MPIKAPSLDDRDFNQMVEESLRYVRENCPQWTDLSPHDPGVVLLELFAFLTEAMTYRLNRLPEKAYIEFLRLIGVRQSPPVAAVATVVFRLKKARNQPVEIPRNTAITLNRTGSSEQLPVFSTLRTIVIEPGETVAEGRAYACEIVEAELVGKGNGQAGLSVSVKRPPIVARTNDDLEMLVGVETTTEELKERQRAIEYQGKIFRIWNEVTNFSEASDGFAYVVDRVTGMITFAPSVQLTSSGGLLDPTPLPLGERPSHGREIRVWYMRGGGGQGNVAPDTLTVLKTQIPGLTVTNPAAATGGRDVESLKNALIRGPQELHSLQRAVTASDFELLAMQSSGVVARARAFTKAALWRHAQPGTIDVSIVPDVPPQQRPNGLVTLESLQTQETEDARQMVRRALDERRPLGTTCLVNWVHYKRVSVAAKAVIHRGADSESVKTRVVKRLNQVINPLQSDLPSNGWEFGATLRASHIYDVLLSERDVSYVEDVVLRVDEVPDKEVTSIAVDHFQPDTWYCATGEKLFRTMDNGEGWELLTAFPGERIDLVRASRIRAGTTVAVTRTGEKGSRLYISGDCGETWHSLAQLEFSIHDISWISRNGVLILLLATDEGLYELSIQAGASPVQILVDAQKPNLGFYAVTASVGIRGTFYVAAAARNLGGIYFSSKGGESGSFTNIGLTGDDVRVLEIQQPDGVRTFLWAGVTVAGNESGKGCFRWELQGSEVRSLVNFQKGWAGGSCNALAFKDSLVFAGTFDRGVLWLDTAKGEAASWHLPVLECGLPIRDAERIFVPVETLAALSDRKCVLAGGRRGIYRTIDDGTNYETVSRMTFSDRVTLPATWLFCSGEHAIDVVSDTAAG